MLLYISGAKQEKVVGNRTQWDVLQECPTDDEAPCDETRNIDLCNQWPRYLEGTGHAPLRRPIRTQYKRQSVPDWNLHHLLLPHEVPSLQLDHDLRTRWMPSGSYFEADTETDRAADLWCDCWFRSNNCRYMPWLVRKKWARCHGTLQIVGELCYCSLYSLQAKWKQRRHFVLKISSVI